MSAINDFANKTWHAYTDENNFVLDYDTYEKRRTSYYVSKTEKQTGAITRTRISKDEYMTALSQVKRMLNVLPKIGMHLVF